MSSQSQTLATIGGKAFNKMFYVIQVEERFLKPGTKLRDTEALLMKIDGPTNLEEVIIRTRTKDYATLEAYLEDYAVSPSKGKWWGGWMFIQVLVKNLDLYNSCWISGQHFKDGTAPSDPPTYMPTPPPVPSYPNVALHLATFSIRHTTRKSPSQPSTPLTAELTFSGLDDYNIKQGPAKLHYDSLGKWHLGGHATEEDIANDLEENGSPWAHVHVLVDGNWIPGMEFIAMRDTPP
jgi:hypothetical protein